MTTDILLIEDDRSLRESTTMLLERSGMRVTAEADGDAGWVRFHERSWGLVLLDIMLPGTDGLELCTRIRRESSVPIIMLTARADTTDLVVGLEIGADDYVTKPFDPPALIARIRAALRRSTAESHEGSIIVGALHIDPTAFVAAKDGVELELSATDFRLLYEFARHPRQVMTREALLRRVWEYDYMGDSRMVDMAVKRLRTKIEDEPSLPRYITTVRGVGYRFNAQ